MLNADYTFVNEARRALRDPRRLRQPLPARGARRRARRAAGRYLRSRQPADRDVVSEPDVAGSAWQVGADEHPWGRRLHPRLQTYPTCRRAATGAGPRPCVIACSNTARIRRVPCVMHRWTRWACRSRTTTRSARGGPRARPICRSTRRAPSPDGTEFHGPTGLRTLVLERQDQFVATLIEKLLAYAIGRGPEHVDRPVIRAIARDAASENYRWSSIIVGIIKSTPFRMRRSAS